MMRRFIFVVAYFLSVRSRGE